MLLKMSDNVGNLTKSLLAAQSLISNVIKDRKGYNFKYGDLPQVLEVIKSATVPNDLIFMQFVGPIIDNKVSLESRLFHSSGEYMSCVSETFVDESPLTSAGKRTRSAVQDVGASVTYLRRKAALAFFSIAEEDEIDCVEKSKPKSNSYETKSASNSSQSFSKGPAFPPASNIATKASLEPVPPVMAVVDSIVTSETLQELKSLIRQSNISEIVERSVKEKCNVDSLDKLSEKQAKVCIAKFREAIDKKTA